MQALLRDGALEPSGQLAVDPSPLAGFRASGGGGRAAGRGFNAEPQRRRGRIFAEVLLRLGYAGRAWRGRRREFPLARESLHQPAETAGSRRIRGDREAALESAVPGDMFASPCYKVGQAFLPVRADRNVCATMFRAFSHTPRLSPACLALSSRAPPVAHRLRFGRGSGCRGSGLPISHLLSKIRG